MNLRTRTVLSSTLLLMLIAVAMALAIARPQSVAIAQVPTPSDDQVNVIAKQLYCPVCENTPLDVCGTEACRQWRELIREKLGQGWSADQIKSYFAEQYGIRVLNVPPASGLNWLVYVLPPILILAGVAILARELVIWTRKASPQFETQGAGASAANGPAPEYLERLEDELKKRG